MDLFDITFNHYCFIVNFWLPLIEILTRSITIMMKSLTKALPNVRQRLNELTVIYQTHNFGKDHTRG